MLLPGNLLLKELKDSANPCPLMLPERKDPRILSKKEPHSPSPPLIY